MNKLSSLHLERLLCANTQELEHVFVWWYAYVKNIILDFLKKVCYNSNGRILTIKKGNSMDFKIKKPFYYVGVQTGDLENRDYHLTLITEVDYGKRTWKAEDDKKPKQFSKELAEEMVICLGINDAFAVVVYSQHELTGQPFVKHTK